MAKYYLAYGSNLNIGQMQWRCPTAKPIGTGMLYGWELLFKGSKTGSYLTIEKRKGCRLPVAVWEVADRDEKALDRYEGYPTFYYKATIKNFRFKGFKGHEDGIEDAFVYIMHERRRIGIPSQHYIDVCGDGYDTFGFSRRYLSTALSKSYREEEKTRETMYGKERKQA